MKKIIICYILFLFLNSCFRPMFGTMSDWSIKLINDYEIWGNSKDISIGFVKDNSMSYRPGIKEGELAQIPPKIIKYSIYNQYICAVINPYLYGGIDDTDEYYILNTIEQKLTGPMSEYEYNILIQDLEIIINEWIETKNINTEWLKNNGYFRIDYYNNKWSKYRK